jgi:hypothetical protein
MSNSACSNCEALEHSHDRKPAVPLRGSCNDILHECPLCKQKWWQINTHFHLWQRVKTDQEWESLKSDLRNPVDDYW